MSRFDEGSGYEMTDREQAEFERDTALAYKEALHDLPAFLAFLDAMPRKRIIASRFMDPKTGDKCAVAAFCEYKGMPKLEMLKFEGQSYLERLENGDGDRDKRGNPVGSEECGGWEGATVAAGERVGLPHLVAYNLAWNNDVNWDTVPHARIQWPGRQGVMIDRDEFDPNNPDHYRMSESLYLRAVPCTVQGTHWIRRGMVEYVSRPMTPEERFERLRAHVARRIEFGEKDVPAIGPDCIECGHLIRVSCERTCDRCNQNMCDGCFAFHRDECAGVPV